VSLNFFDDPVKRLYFIEGLFTNIMLRENQLSRVHSIMYQ